ncbi:proline-rich protein [Sesamum angolense]|uniref:Proline-rich protein n=1 Tax=Sesamum angolense TaxID=2727404 RepID=A0AAE2BUC0_9LAMI|nr:proline-rich protein [Sesamum angolense]
MSILSLPYSSLQTTKTPSQIATQAPPQGKTTTPFPTEASGRKTTTLRPQTTTIHTQTPFVHPPVIPKPPSCTSDSLSSVIPKPPIVHPPIVYPPVIPKPPIVHPPIVYPPVIPKPPIVYPPVIPKPPIIYPPIIPKPPSTPKPPVVVPPPPPTVTPKPPPTETPCPPPPPSPSPPKAQETCPIDTLKLGACVDVLGGLVHIGIGSSAKDTCCPVLQGLVDLDAAICLCTTIKAKLLNINIILPIALEVLVDCGKTPPSGFQCPA